MSSSASILLVAEDALGLALGRRLIREHEPALRVWRETNAQGWGAIRRDILKYDQLARNGIPVLALTDLDSRPCCPVLFDDWLGKGHACHPNLLLRICVREAEAWLMADPGPLASFLRLPVTRIPVRPEELPDPKRTLIELAGCAPAKIRKGLVPEPDSTARIGPEYNQLLCRLISTQWNICTAATHAPSLAKARQRVEELASRVDNRGKEAIFHRSSDDEA